MISAEKIVAAFRTALDGKWGYVWGTSGTMWTDALQKTKVRYMVTKYGSNWKNSESAKKDNHYGTAMYAQKWVGRMVSDCSGLFVYAFRQNGGSIYHGSNSIWDRYCTNQGKLTKGKRADGKPLLPGTAVFVYHADVDKRTHIGLYVGNGKVIEASGTTAGVITSDITHRKWVEWGELKGISYDDQTEPQKPEPSPDLRPTLRRGDKGKWVISLQTALLNRGYDLGSYGVDGDYGKATQAAVKAFQRDNGLSMDGICGPKTWAAIDNAGKQPTYRVTVEGVTWEQYKKILSVCPLAEAELED